MDDFERESIIGVESEKCHFNPGFCHISVEPGGGFFFEEVCQHLSEKRLMCWPIPLVWHYIHILRRQKMFHLCVGKLSFSRQIQLAWIQSESSCERWLYYKVQWCGVRDVGKVLKGVFCQRSCLFCWTPCMLGQVFVRVKQSAIQIILHR